MKKQIKKISTPILCFLLLLFYCFGFINGYRTNKQKPETIVSLQLDLPEAGQKHWGIDMQTTYYASLYLCVWLWNQYPETRDGLRPIIERYIQTQGVIGLDVDKKIRLKLNSTEGNR
ncbi:MAG TPA: hypothetical protein ENI52_01255 [Thermoplasmata archaeon]|nr:hypothetical protein [Thermoplasmata archaeon]